MNPIILSGGVAPDLILGPLHDIASGTAVVGDPDKQTILVCHGAPEFRDAIAARITDSRYLTTTTNLRTRTVNGARAVPTVYLLPKSPSRVAALAGEREDADAPYGAAVFVEWAVKPYEDAGFPLLIGSVPDLGAPTFAGTDASVMSRARMVKTAFMDMLDRRCNTIHLHTLA